MHKLGAIVVTAAICLPLGALLRGDASADRRKNALPAVDIGGEIAGHRHLSRAHAALHEAATALEASQQSDEPLWSDATGRAAAVTDAIQKAVSTMDRTAEWVTHGMYMSAQDPSTLQPARRRRLLVR